MNIDFKKDYDGEVKRGNIYWYIYNGHITPVMVIQNDIGNYHSDYSIIVKMSASNNLDKKNIPTLVKIFKHEIVATPKKANTLKEEGYLLCSDIKTIKKNTLKNYIGFLIPSSTYKINKALKISLDIV